MDPKHETRRLHPSPSELDEGDARAQLAEILEALPDTVALFDAEGRLVIFNAEYREESLSDVVRPGVRFEDIVRAAIDRKLLPVPGGDAEAYARSLVEECRAGGAEGVVRISDDQWMLFRSRRTTTGGFLIVRGDVTQVVRSHRERLGQESGKNEALRTEIERRRRTKQELRASEARYRALCDNALDVICETDGEGNVLYISSGVERMLGVPPAELTGKSFRKFLHIEDVEVLAGQQGQEEVAGESQGIRFRARHRNGEWRWLEASWKEFQNEEGAGRVAAVIHDVTDGRRSELMFRGLVEAAPDAMLIVNSTGKIELVNEQAEELFGYAREELLGRLPELLVPERSKGVHVALRQEATSRGTRHQMGSGRRIYALHKDGFEFPVDISLSPLQTEEGGLVVASIRDVTKSVRSEEKIWNLAFYDSLTGLPNRRLFHDRLSVALQLARPHGHLMALLFVDLDRFKLVNDQFGHAAGDDLLCAVSERFLACIRGGDSIARLTSEADDEGDDGRLFRLGGDEFTLLLSEISTAEDAMKVANRLLNSLSIPFQIGDREVHATASIGIALYPHDGEDADDLMASADAAMYHAKAANPNVAAFHTAAMTKAARRTFALEDQLRGALEKGEFSVLYQPIRDGINGALVGAEALLRWNSPEFGQVSPDEFIGIAEAAGLIHPIGERVLRTACAQHRNWQEAGFRAIRIGVNVSGVQFQNKRFAELVSQVLLETGTRASHLELEITESTVMQNDFATAEVLRKLSDQGVSLALDDFGTGYSSLTYLRRFPLSRVKIDRSFTQGLPENASDVALTRSIVAMAHGLGLGVVAEGVETEAQAECLREQGCDDLQGFLFSRPVSAEEFARFLEKEKDEAS